ncbi:MAG: alpha-mannosidase, partial [Mycobacteriaceae bacterium]|nr:alpha-mannosidase [Mycobacteriaceae bacterium]
ARDNALALLSSVVDGSIVVWNPLAHSRTDIITARLPEPVDPAVRVVDADGAEVPALSEHGGRSVSWLARDVPSLGWRGYRLIAGKDTRHWEQLAGNVIANEHYRVTVDPARGGTVSSLVEIAAERELIGSSGVGNELAVYEEYPAHPQSGEGPWHLVPRGPVVCSSEVPAESVRAYRSPMGQRLVVSGRVGTVLRYTQTLTLWDGVARVECRTTIDEFTGVDRLVRLRWHCPVHGALPVSEVGDAVIGRGFGLMHERGAESCQAVDAAHHPWTLDNPAYGWFGLSSAARIRVGDGVRAVAVAEVVTPSETISAPLARELMVALVRAGVTATCSGADKPRYGGLDVDSNLPDTRIAIGGPDENAFTAEVLASADPVYGDELKRQLYATGAARVWVPAAAPLAEQWAPGADLRGARTLPVLVIAGSQLAGAVESVVEDLADAEISVIQDAPTELDAFEAHTVALLNRGIPGFAVGSDGTLHTSLMRSCTGWPSGTWIDPPRRTVPDGSNFALQHWTHTFDYALVSGGGDWRSAGLPARSAEFCRPLYAARGGGERAGGLPRFGSLLEVEPAGAVQLAALKAAGNPLASGSGHRVDLAEGVAVRLTEALGAQSTAVVIRCGMRNVVGHVGGPATSRADLLERARLHSLAADGLRLHGFEIATVLTRLNLPKVLDADHAALAPNAEAAQPLY